MRSLFSSLVVLVMLFGAAMFGVIAFALLGYSNVAAALFGLFGVVCVILAIRRLAGGGARSRSVRDEASLENWKSADAARVTRPRDPRTKFCLANIGKEVPIRYRGHQLQIVPLRVYTKANYRKTYVDAMNQGAERTYDIDDMEVR